MESCPMIYTAASLSTTPPAHYRASLYQDTHDEQRHLHRMHAIAEEVGRPVEEIAALYEDVLEDLKAQARIFDYLPVLVSKKVKKFFRMH
jgi:uncharacterized protein (DUF2126 family)